MKIVFVSNYYNHHQHALSQALDRITEGQYHFVATSEMRADRKALGYGQWELPPYVILAHLSEEENRRSRKLIEDADVVIVGSAPWDMIKSRVSAGKLVFRYCERPLKQEKISVRQRIHFLKTRLTCGKNRSVYLLCAGGYVAADYDRFGCFRGRSYQWGYFPQTSRYAVPDQLLAEKEKTTILWAGRFLDWKHPELALQVAKRLREDGYSFNLTMIGTGNMGDELEGLVREYGLQACVHLTGAMRPEQVRQHMEKAGIYLLTSDRQEGWGAVLNESMNSGCAIVASHAAGAVPYLLKDGENGLIFKSGDADALYEKVKKLLDAPQKQAELGRKAYDTITQLWNAEVAAQRLAELSSHILAGEKRPALYESGPCSPAEILD